MSKPHSSLSIKTNLLLIPIWGAVATYFLFFAEPCAPIALGALGAILGAIGGIMQHLSFGQATSRFSSARTALEVRAVFKSTPWGNRYIRFLYLSKFILAALAFLLIRQPLLDVVFGYLAGYFSLMFVREIATLRDTFVLQRLQAHPPESQHTVV